MLIDHHDQQIVPRIMLRDQRGDQPSKKWEISISGAIQLGFLRSLVSTIRCEANKSNRRREERPIASRPVNMLRYPRGHTRDLGHHVAVANARAEVRAHLHNWSIWCQWSLCTIGCMMAHSKTRPARGEPTGQNSTCGRGNLDRSNRLGFSRSLGSTTSNEANKSAMLRAEWTMTAGQGVLRLAQMKYRYFVPEQWTLQAECDFFRCKSSKTGHMSMIYRQTGNILSVSSKGTAAAKWLMKISR